MTTTRRRRYPAAAGELLTEWPTPVDHDPDDCDELANTHALTVDPTSRHAYEDLETVARHVWTHHTTTTGEPPTVTAMTVALARHVSMREAYDLTSRI